MSFYTIYIIVFLQFIIENMKNVLILFRIHFQIATTNKIKNKHKFI